MSPRHVHPDPNTCWACPHCDHAPVYRRERKNLTHAPNCEFVCYECKEGVDDPVERPIRRSGGGRTPKAFKEYLQRQTADSEL